jgi:hypothetical protein
MEAKNAESLTLESNSVKSKVGEIENLICDACDKGELYIDINEHLNDAVVRCLRNNGFDVNKFINKFALITRIRW